MKNNSIVLLALSSILFFCFPSFAASLQGQKGILFSTELSAEKLEGVIPCDARANPLLYYVPVDEMQCDVPGGYGIDFEGTLERRESETVVYPHEDRLTLLTI